MISIIVAMAENNVIGADGDMPWRLSTDLQRFKRLTMGKVMVMGRKTFDSIGKALPGRTSIVITRNKSWQAEGVIPVPSLEAALEVGAEIAATGDEEEICIVGGGQIYAQALEFADKLHVTKVKASPTGDTVFPSIDDAVFDLVFEENIPAGEKDTFETVYCVYKRRDNLT